MSRKKFTPPEKWILIIIPILFLVGSSLHFLFELSGDNILVGFFAAVNESVWEHSKMLVLPMILFWSLYYLFKGKKYCIDKDKWFTSALISLVTALIVMPFLYYFYTEAFGVEILLVDILILLIAITLGQTAALHFYKYSKGLKWEIALTLSLLIMLGFICLTLYPPHIPMFIDDPSGQYGIIK